MTSARRSNDALAAELELAVPAAERSGNRYAIVHRELLREAAAALRGPITVTDTETEAIAEAALAVKSAPMVANKLARKKLREALAPPTDEEIDAACDAYDSYCAENGLPEEAVVGAIGAACWELLRGRMT